MISWPAAKNPSLENIGKLPQLSLTNSKTNEVEQVAIKKMYRMYVCGITPYDATHLGHAATYLTFDLISRYLTASGAQVKYVQNITDIDDPLLERAKRDNVDWEELATSQIDLFRSDMVNLRVLPPDHYIGAVEAIDLVSQSVTDLDSKGSIYSIDKDLYFRNYSSPGFGSLSHLSEAEMSHIFSQRGGDPNLLGKESPLDCLVWMAKREGEPGWESVHGTGRPGWHIECTAIALQYLQPDKSDAYCIDIQGGGSDLIFPHHEMCASQAYVLTGKELAATYVHSAMIGLDGEKMSKSKGNLVFVSTLVRNGEDPMAIRLALLSQHYRQDRMWTSELFDEGKLRLLNLRKAFQSQEVAATEGVIAEICQALSHDLDTPHVFRTLDDWVVRTLRGEKGGSKDMLKTALDALLGLAL